MTTEEADFILETLRACWSEIGSMESTYDDYVVSGHLEEQVTMAVSMLEYLLNGDG